MNDIIPTNPNQLARTGQAADLLRDWRASLELRVRSGNLAASTAETYLRGAGKLIDWVERALPGTPLIDAETLMEWQAYLVEHGLHPGTINTWFAGVRSLFAWAVQQGQLPTTRPLACAAGGEPVPTNGTAVRR